MCSTNPAALVFSMSDAVPKPEELQPYFKDGVIPTCPDGGTYYLNNVETVPTCTIQGHALAP